MAIDTGSLEDATDEALVVTFQDGDPDAFAQIVETYHGVLLARARRQLRSNDDAQDAVQETLLRAFRYLPNFAGDYHLAAWLNRILSNVIADAKRQHGVQVRLQTRLAGVRDVERVPEEFLTGSVDDGQVRAAVESAISALSSDYRQAFMLRAVEDQSYAEIAEVLDISEVNARARVYRARTSLQRSLKSASGGFAAVFVAGRNRIAKTFGRQLVGGVSTSSRTRPIGSSQTVAQMLGSSTGQTLSTIASESSRSLFPVSGTLASLVTSAAVAVVAPATALLAPASSSPVPAQANQVTLAHAEVTSAVVSTTSTSSTTTSTTSTTVPSSTTTTTTPPTSSKDQSSSPAATNSPWSWVSGTSAASGPAAVGSTATGPTVACPYLQSFPGSTSSSVTLPPAESSESNATSYLSTGTVTLPSIGPSFDSSSLGTFSSGSEVSDSQILFGACSPSTSTPALVANVTNADATSNGELQLRGALASSSTSAGETDTYYRGTAQWLTGSNVGTAPVEFVADVTTDTADNTVDLHVAFFGPENGLLSASQQACIGTSGAVTSSASTSAASTATGTADQVPSSSQVTPAAPSNPAQSACEATGSTADAADPASS